MKKLLHAMIKLKKKLQPLKKLNFHLQKLKTLTSRKSKRKLKKIDTVIKEIGKLVVVK